jgi:nucleotide-binding universal stress UspA family protein
VVQVEIKVRSSPVPTEILEEARDSGADLIAMTTHGQSGASRLLFGSVTKAVLRDTTVPVFLKSVRHVSASRAAA